LPAVLQITVAEALLTLLQFVLLLVIGWGVDVKVWERFLPNRVANSASDAIVVSSCHDTLACKLVVQAACSSVCHVGDCLLLEQHDVRTACSTQSST
jgi:hypothetical protein